MAWRDMTVMPEGACWLCVSSKYVNMTWMMQKETRKSSPVDFLPFIIFHRFGPFKGHFEPPGRPVLLSHPTNSHTADPIRSIVFVASSDYVMIAVDSMVSDHFFGDRGAFDAAALVALAPADAPQIEVTDGNEHAPTHQGAVLLRVRGCGKYAGSDRTIKLLNAKLVPGFPSHQRLVSSRGATSTTVRSAA